MVGSKNGKLSNLACLRDVFELFCVLFIQSIEPLGKGQ